MNKKLKLAIIVLIITFVSLLIIFAGLSYAGYNFKIYGSNINYISSGCLSSSLTDTGSISNLNAVPMSDSDGLKTSPYTYTIKNSCENDLKYIVTLNVMEGSNLDNLSKVKVSLDGDANLYPMFEKNLISVKKVDNHAKDILKTYKLDEGVINKNAKKTFNFRSWIDYDVTDVKGKLINKIIVKEYE